MTQQRPITPPPELVQQWRKSGPADAAVNNAYECHIAIQAAQWGADQELEAICEFLGTSKEWNTVGLLRELRAARRPKPPSLKEVALGSLQILMKGYYGDPAHADLIRRALEQLPE